MIHAIAGGYALGLLLDLGPRIGKFAADGTPRDIPPHNPWLLTIGEFFDLYRFLGVLCRLQRSSYFTRSD